MNVNRLLQVVKKQMAMTTGGILLIGLMTYFVTSNHDRDFWQLVALPYGGLLFGLVIGYVFILVTLVRFQKGTLK